MDMMREYNADLGELQGRLANETARKAVAEDNIMKLQNDIRNKQTEIDLLNFMGDRFEYEPSYFMSMEDFKEEFFQYRKANGRDKIRWNSALYIPIFHVYSVLPTTDKRVYNGTSVVKEWILGLKFTVA